MELKANELRIGNLIYGVSDRIEKITYITERYVKTNHLKIDAESQIFGVEHLSPILITDEWLLRLGFTEPYQKGYFVLGLEDECNSYLFFNINKRGFAIESEDNSRSLSKSIALIYVHQLQNLYFALTNKELEIKM